MSTRVENGPSEYDLAHIQDILLGHGDWFSAQLFRLIAKADADNRARLALGFPEHVQAFIRWSQE